MEKGNQVKNTNARKRSIGGVSIYSLPRHELAMRIAAVYLFCPTHPVGADYPM